MFRHSEIQRLLAERRRKREAEEEQQKRQTRKRRAAHEAEEMPTVFDNDSVVHARGEVQQLSYDDTGSQTKAIQPKTFHWPVLGS